MRVVGAPSLVGPPTTSEGALNVVTDPEHVELDEWQRLYLFTRADTIYGGSNGCSATSSPSGCSAYPERPAHERTTPFPACRRPRGDRRPQPLVGKKVVVTAAAGTGIGFATARRALLEGADVLVSDFHERRLGETVETLAAEFGDQQVASFVCDVSSTEQVDALIASAAQQLGRIDVLVNNAGLGGETPVADMTDEQWDRVLDITLNSTFRATRAALRYFRDAAAANPAQRGVIVNNASVLGWRASVGRRTTPRRRPA